MHVVADLHRDLALEHEVDLLDRLVAVTPVGSPPGGMWAIPGSSTRTLKPSWVGAHRAPVAEERARVLAGEVGRVGARMTLYSLMA